MTQNQLERIIKIVKGSPMEEAHKIEELLDALREMRTDGMGRK